MTAKSRLFTLGAKGFYLPRVDLSVRVAGGNPLGAIFSRKSSCYRRILFESGGFFSEYIHNERTDCFTRYKSRSYIRALAKTHFLYISADAYTYLPMEIDKPARARGSSQLIEIRSARVARVTKMSDVGNAFFTSLSSRAICIYIEP